MTNVQLISEIPMNIYELKKDLDRIKKRDNELNFRSAKTEDYINQIATLKHDDELFSKIMHLNIPRLKEQHINKIIDIAPTTPNELKVVLQSYTITVSNESIKKIVDTINEFLGKD